MHIRLSSEPAPGRPVNEDTAFAVSGLVGVLDGVTAPEDVDSGCSHGPAWYVRQLAAHLVRGHDRSPDAPLAHLLADAIRTVAADHGGTCDLAHPGTPASTVCLLADRGNHVEYLLLCDSPLVLDRGDVQVLTDDRLDRAVATLRAEALAGGGSFDSAGYSARLRPFITKRQQLTNRPGGYWIAAADPAAAHHAVTGTAPLHGPDRVRRAALLTDGASAAVEQFALMDWAALLDVLTDQGPHELIRRVREAEAADHDGRVRPRYKRHDDATAAVCLFEEEPG
ncbi:hypothetical protein HC031_21950 [Planosporangium thailandense]|uniref:Integrase n=1 Tax=Planosporangium thailandense TaxID=765197 RepID=A0ABX0Y1Z2_9ACTN|nr:hypothetical protein [Planosporangium thailandense]NJC72360.1 hypothetical protein [Planosporangium thailandense]